MLKDARHAAAAFLLPPGAGAVAAAPVAPQPAPVAGVDEKWARIESAGENLCGALVELDGSEVLQGDVGLKLVDGKWIAIRRMKQSDIADFCGAEASADARLLGIKFQGIRREERTWRDVSDELVEETFQDWGVPGPRTAAWCVRLSNRRNRGSMDHDRLWIHGLRSDSWGATEHETLSKIIDKLAKFDGLDLSNLAGAEVTFRRLQLIEYFYSERGPGGGKGAGKSSKDSKKDDDGAYKFESTIFRGSHKEFGDVMVAPDLLSYVAKVEQEASVMKQIRKAREERAAAAAAK